VSVPVEPARNRPSVLLIVSLCLNVALIGLIAIALARFGMHGFEPRDAKGGLSAQALMRMAPSERAKIETLVAAHRGRLRELRGAATQARADSFALLTSPGFDPAEFARSLAAVQSADAALEAETLKLTADSIAVLTPAERARVAQTVRRPHGAWLKRMFRRH